MLVTALQKQKESFREEGRAEGRAEGRFEGELNKSRIYTIKILEKKFKLIPSDIKEKIEKCTDMLKLDSIVENIFELSDYSEVKKILD